MMVEKKRTLFLSYFISLINYSICAMSLFGVFAVPKQKEEIRLVSQFIKKELSEMPPSMKPHPQPSQTKHSFEVPQAEGQLKHERRKLNKQHFKPA